MKSRVTAMSFCQTVSRLGQALGSFFRGLYCFRRPSNTHSNLVKCLSLSSPEQFDKLRGPAGCTMCNLTVRLIASDASPLTVILISLFLLDQILPKRRAVYSTQAQPSSIPGHAYAPLNPLRLKPPSPVPFVSSRRHVQSS